MSRKSRKKVSLAKLNTLRLDQDGPTPERLAKLPGVTIVQKPDGVRVAAFGPGERKPVAADGIVRITDAPLDRLAARQRLDEGDEYRNEKLHEAGDRLRQHWYRSDAAGSLGSMDLNRADGGNGHPAWLTPKQESTAYHRERFRRARDGMDAGHWEVVFGICCGEDTLEGVGRRVTGIQNKDGANAVALDRLRRALAFLAIAWGILPPHPANDDRIDSIARSRMVVRGDEVDQIIDQLMVANVADALKKVG